MKQRVALSNHLRHVRDKDLFRLLKKELKKALSLEEQILKRITAYILKHPRLKADYQRLLTIPEIGEKSAPPPCFTYLLPRCESKSDHRLMRIGSDTT